MNKVLIICFLIFSHYSFSQTIRGFGGTNVYLNNSFEKSGYVNLHTGIDIEIKKYLKPEFEVALFIGVLQKSTNYDSNNNFVSEVRRKINAVNYSFSPKIIFGDGQSNNGYFQILPKFNFTRSEAKSEVYTINNDGYLAINKSDTQKSFKFSVGIGVGIIVNLSDKNYSAIALNLFYDNINISKVAQSLQVGAVNVNSNQSLGIGINYYFGFYKRKMTN